MDCRQKEVRGSGGVSGGSESKKEDCGSGGSESARSGYEIEDMDILNAVAYEKVYAPILALGLGGDGNQCGGIDKPVYDIQNALHWACVFGILKCVKVLVGHEADLFLGNKVGETPLHVACSHGHRNVAEYLIKSAFAKNKQHGVDNLLGAVDNVGETPLHAAAAAAFRVGTCDVIQLLLNYGADPCKEANCHELPFQLALPGTEARQLLELAAVKRMLENM